MAGRIRVLYVCVTQTATEQLPRHLESQHEDATVEAVSGAAECLDRLDTSRVDAIVSEYALSDRDGTGRLEAVREDHPYSPFGPESRCAAPASGPVSSVTSGGGELSSETGDTNPTVAGASRGGIHIRSEVDPTVTRYGQA